jgi:tetratricopeptide (TPR) repeat protein
MKTLLIIISFCMFIICFTDSISYSEPFFIERGKRYAEIEVEVGTDFQVNLQGGGWYLNRYDEEKLSFERRSTDMIHTEFIIRSLQTGEAYLFFSYLEEDVYVRVNIFDAIPEPHSTPVPALEPGEIDAQKPEKTSEDSMVEKKIKEKVQAPPGGVKEENEGGHKDIYYIDKEDRKIDVPFSSEDDAYFHGIRQYKKRDMENAVKLFEEYLSECTQCSHMLEAHKYLAEIHIKVENENEALSHLQLLIERGNADQRKNALSVKARIDYRRGKLDEALNGYHAVLDFEPENEKILRRIGDIHFELQNFGDALDAYQKSVAHGIDDDEVYYRIAVICESPGALKDLEKAYVHYKIIVDRFHESKHYTYAQKRVVFFETNFYHYK